MSQLLGEEVMDEIHVYVYIAMVWVGGRIRMRGVSEVCKVQLRPRVVLKGSWEG